MTRTLDQEVRDGVAAGETFAGMAQRLGITKGAISGRVRRLGLNGPAYVPWTNEQLNWLRELRAAGISRRNIARMMHVPVGAVGRQCAKHAIPLLGRAPDVLEQLEEPDVDDAPQPPRAWSVWRYTPPPSNACGYPLWPHGAAPNMRFCEAPRAGRVYCAEHRAVCYTPRSSLAWAGHVA